MFRRDVWRPRMGGRTKVFAAGTHEPKNSVQSFLEIEDRGSDKYKWWVSLALTPSQGERGELWLLPPDSWLPRVIALDRSQPECWGNSDWRHGHQRYRRRHLVCLALAWKVWRKRMITHYFPPQSTLNRHLITKERGVREGVQYNYYPPKYNIIIIPQKVTIYPQLVNISPEIILILQNMLIYALFIHWLSRVASTHFLSPNPPVWSVWRFKERYQQKIFRKIS